jgi:ribosomal protein S18 acetylase RimI-like enzyme
VDEAFVAAALDSEVEFVLALGGLALRLPGAILVTHEKIPAPAFNYVTVRGVAPQRQTAFFERALDHYFQRAIRPRFRVRLPVPPHLESGLSRLGFSKRTEPLTLMLESNEQFPEAAAHLPVRPATDREIDALAEFWAAPKERPEFRTALDIAWHHPNPNEALVPLILPGSSGVVGAALLYRHGTTASIHWVGTRTSERGQGAASELVRYALRARPLGRPIRYSMIANSARLVRRLRLLGFEPGPEFAEFELAADAQLAMPNPGPAGPPRWRPPRGF